MTHDLPVELFVSDIHGEYEECSHIIRSACGLLRDVIDDAFGAALSPAEKDALAALVYYPHEKGTLELLYAEEDGSAAIEERFERAIDALATLHAHLAGEAATEALELPDEPLAALCELARAIQLAAVSHLYVVGDIYDRGPSPDLMMDELAAFPSLDILWGNHDILWMGAALGQRGCVATVVRICARYGNLSVLEENYGIDLKPLRDFACTVYADDPCVAFGIKGNPDISEEKRRITAKIQKAMAYIQFKVDAQLIDENPSFGLADRKLLHRIDYAEHTVEVDGIVYPLKDPVFPTINPADPYRLSTEEARIMDYLVNAFTQCEKLQRHMSLFLNKGSLYRIAGNTLLFHACVPLNPDGSLKEVELFGKTLKGRSLFDAVDGYVRAAFTETDPVARKRGLDILWYLWLGQGSPLFAKSKMATFEIYQIEDKAARKEVKNSFYALLEDKAALGNIFREFGMDTAHSRIVCGHVPVKVKDGEDPIKCGGRAIIIDGGMSAPYQSTSGIAGFTIVARGRDMRLAAHETFSGRQAAIEENATLRSSWRALPTLN